MPRPITLYITASLANEYRRRCSSSHVTTWALAGFPQTCSKHRVPVEIAWRMLRDARYWGWVFEDLEPLQVQAYRSVAYQIERGLERRSITRRREEAVEMLRWVVYVWVQRFPSILDA